MQKKRRRIFNHKMLGVFEKLGNEVATLILVCFFIGCLVCVCVVFKDLLEVSCACAWQQYTNLI